MTSPDLIQADLHRMSWSQLAKAAEESTVHHDYARALILWRHAYHAATLTINKNLATAKINCKRKLTAVCSHQTRIGNLDAHLI